MQKYFLKRSCKVKLNIFWHITSPCSVSFVHINAPTILYVRDIPFIDIYVLHKFGDHYVQIYILTCTHKLKTYKFWHIKSHCSSTFGQNAPIVHMCEILSSNIIYKFEVITYKSFLVNVPAS